jgi:sugar-specific transcriptional regulator TrmB
LAEPVTNPEFIARLRSMGLSQYEAQVYLGLLGEQAADVATIIRKSGVPQNKTYEALETLVDKGFAEQVLAEKKRFRAAEPAMAFARHSARVRAELAAQEQAMAAIAAAAPRGPAREPSAAGIRLIPGVQVPVVFEELMRVANKELLVSLRAPLLRVGSVEQARNVRAQGLRAKWLVETTAFDDHRTGKALRDWAEAISQVRAHDAVPMAFAVYDGATVLLDMREEDGSRFALLMPNRALAQDLRALFLGLYAAATPAEELRPAKARK